MLWCCCCGKDTKARLTSGSEVYPFRKDLAANPFWICDTCRNFVGCHHRSSNRTRPLGSIPTPEMRRLRSEVHKVLDRVWRDGWLSRKKTYRLMGDFLGKKEFHVAETRTAEEVGEALIAAERISGMFPATREQQ